MSKNYPRFNIGKDRRNNNVRITKKKYAFYITHGLNRARGSVSLELVGKRNYFVRVHGWKVIVQRRQNNRRFRRDASFRLRKNRFFKGFVSFESWNRKNFYLRHQGYLLKLHRMLNTLLYRNDASFRIKHVKKTGNTL